MGKFEILEEEGLSMSEIKTELLAIKKRDKELNYRANSCLDYLNHFETLDKKKSDELFKKIKDLDVPRIREAYIKKIIDILPRDVESLKIIIQAYPITVNNDNCKKIVDTINNFLPKKEKKK